VVLYLDTTDLPLQGNQEGRFLRGDYDEYGYLPQYVFCGEPVRCPRLRASNHEASFGCLAEIRRIVGPIQAAWAEVGIILGGDYGFCREELMSWCEDHGVDFVLGMARKQRLRGIIGADSATAQGTRPASRRGSLPLPNQKEEERRLEAGPARGGQGRAINGKENPRFGVDSYSESVPLLNVDQSGASRLPRLSWPFLHISRRLPQGRQPGSC
jgi:hypothetical protein